ncbi:MAG: glycosyltransferase [Proteobacteria bacterium]|nr:glycosyltransferase [Pseudomonadota bacterium]
MHAQDPIPPRARLSAVVVACNRAWSIETCLAAVAFADEVVLVDKSSTDGTAERGAQHADRVIRVPWSPTVEATRAFAVAQCTHEWVLLLDDDECLNPEAVLLIAAEMAAPRADIYCLPLRHYILGCHDPRCYYWPEWHPRLFRRDAVAFADTVHGGLALKSERIHRVPVETGACIHHLSHRSVGEWIEKTNRYTAAPDRVRVGAAETDLAAFAHRAIDRWRTASRPDTADDTPCAVALLRATYDIVDRLKTWEEERGLDGAAAFRDVCAGLRAGYASQLAHLHRPHRAAGFADAAPAALAPALPAAAVSAPDPALRSLLAGLRAEAAALHAQLGAERDRGAADRALNEAERDRAIRQLERLGDERDRAFSARDRSLAERDRAAGALAPAQARADALDAAVRAMTRSTSWRITAPLRSFAVRHAGLARALRRGARLAARLPARRTGRGAELEAPGG